MVPIYKGERDVTNCSVYREVKFLKHGMKIIERVSEKRIRALVEVGIMQIKFMPGGGMTDYFFIVKTMQKEYKKKDK